MRGLVMAALLVLAPALAHAGDPAATLRQAGDALDSGDYDRAAKLVAPLVGQIEAVAAIDRAEAYRLYGLSLFFLDRLGQAEAALLEYLRLDPEAHLDPARYPPEVIIFFEDIRARHRAELVGLKERPRTVREWSKNLFPPWGQLENGHRAKAWTLLGLGTALAAANLITYAVLRSWCDPHTLVCESDGRDRRNTAIALQWVNVGSGLALIGVYAYGVIDGFYHHRQISRSEQPRYMSVGVSPTRGGGMASLSWRF